MASTAGGAFGFASGLIIQEFGYDDDVDETLRQAVEAETGTTLVDEDYQEMVEALGIPFDGDYVVIPKNWENKHTEIVENKHDKDVSENASV